MKPVNDEFAMRSIRRWEIRAVQTCSIIVPRYFSDKCVKELILVWPIASKEFGIVIPNAIEVVSQNTYTTIDCFDKLAD